MKHLIHVLIQLFTSVIIAQQRPFRQQLIGTQRAGRDAKAGAACKENRVSRNTCEAPATPERTGLKYTDSSSLKAGIIDVQVTSAVAAPL